ncbi:hypothetical protein DPMN_174609 [Dreissena polymorpha]|uniref:Uncharacterized protein n=1 Tax=Dreissena polymorpha TaxID=45954 RepID=A0A9D4E4Y2_DREPO|nr:hypothetical protein DPMN_174609 [Dreissena polymorpha]
MQDTLQDNYTSISVGDRPISNMFTDDIDRIRQTRSDLKHLTNRVYERAEAFRIEVIMYRTPIGVFHRWLACGYDIN